MRSKLALVVVAAVVAVPAAAHAASCCGSVLALGDRLSPGDRASVQFQVGAEAGLGWSDGAARFHASPAGSRDGALRLATAASVRVAGPWQLSLTVPVVAGLRAMGPRSDAGGGVGDVTAGLLFDPGPLSSWWAAAAITAPTGRATADSRAPLGADVTGRGQFALRASANVERIRDEWFARLQLSGDVAGPTSDGLFRGGLGGELLAWAGRSFEGGAAISGGLRFGARSELPASATGTLNAGLGLVLAAGWPFAPDWLASATVAIDPPLDYASRHRASTANVSLGVRRVY